MKIGIADVGGGMRDIYGAGILDYCMEEGITFHHCEGVSAGSANMAAFLAGQPHRNYSFYTEYAFRKEYMSFRNWIRNGNFIDLDYIYSTLSDSHGESPLDYPALAANPAELKIIATNALTGEPMYFDKSSMKQDAYHVIKASGCVPIANKAYVIDNIPYFDGGMSDPIPFRHCFDSGCDRVVIVLTRPKEFRRDPGKDRWAARLLKHKYPNAAKALAGRADLYNAQLDEAVRLEQQGLVLILAPDSIEGMKTLTKDRPAMDILYQKGYQDAVRIRPFLASLS